MKDKALQILLVEDNAGDARLLREMFRKESPDSFVLTHLSRLSDAEVHLAENEVDIVLLDMGLPDGHGLDTVRRALAVAPAVPLIVLTGLEDEMLAAEAMKAGAQDYLIKGQIENRALPRALRHAIERYRMKTETEFIRTNQTQFKDGFFSHVSHELRTPVTAIYQFVTILLDGLAGELNSQQSEYLELVLRNVRQLQAMIHDLLEVTRADTGKSMIQLQRISVSDAIADTVDAMKGAAAAKEISFSSDIDGGPADACADPARLRQILRILVDNAIKFTPAKGAVTVRSRMLDDPNFLLVEVADSGCGFSPEMNTRIFERLFQVPDSSSAGRRGLGLGLYICRELLAQQGGTIQASGVPGQGAVFSVTLPVFSLANLIAPAFRRERHAQGPVFLVVTEIGSQAGWLSDDTRAEESHAIRELLQLCLHSGQDILLPRMGPTGSAELFFIVTTTSGVGCEALTRRIREQLEGSADVRRAGLTHSTSFWALETIKRNVGQSMEDFVRKAAAGIQILVDREISSRLTLSGQ